MCFQTTQRPRNLNDRLVFDLTRLLMFYSIKSRDVFTYWILEEGEDLTEGGGIRQIEVLIKENARHV